jgi:lipopolysaccharide/colanic/teichoic acid biosynthesis glycosyltransferase
LKRFFEIAGAILLLVLLAPILACIAVAIRINLGRPILFRQVRIGRHEHPFRILKFRTMILDEHLPDAERLTPLGRFLRKFSLDELPQLWNILAGDMSFVGPRPLLPEYLPRYTAHQRRRHEVKPGITGWAQVHGRNAITWEEKFSLDVWYVDHRSLWLDLRILVLTALRVLRQEGISRQGHVTSPEFLGVQHGQR